MRGLVLTAYAVSGFCALALEVVWFRLLTIVFIGTTYAFTTMLTALLCGLALGSLVAAPFVDRRRGPVTLLGILQVLIALACLWTLVVFPTLPAKLKQMQIDAGFQWDGLVRARFTLSFAVLFLPTFLFGMGFPVAVKALTGRVSHVGRDIGRLYSVNTLGGVLGALAGGYLLIPVLGAQRATVVLALLQFAMGLALIAACPYRRGVMKTALLACAAVSIFGVWRNLPADVCADLNQSYLPEGDQLVHFREGVEGTVAVSQPAKAAAGADRVLWINAVQATTSIQKGVKMNRFEGVLPMLFDRPPKRALFMCFGSGITAGTLGLFDYETIDAVEISRDVLDAAPYFAKDNFNVRENPKLRFHVTDGRNFLMTAKQRYDLITFEPMPLALAGVSTFYTQEYYRLCLDHLTEGGLVSQWVPLHSLSPDIVRSLVYTFTTVFPEYCAWFLNADLFVVGSNRPLRLDYQAARERLENPAIAQALAAAGLDDLTELFSCFVMDKDNVNAYARGGTAMTDDRPWAEFLAPKVMYERNVPDAMAQLKPFLVSPAAATVNATPAEREALERRFQARLLDWEGVMTFYRHGFLGEPEASFRKALAIDPNDRTARHYLKEIVMMRVPLFQRWNEPERAIEALNGALRDLPDDPQLHLLLADVYYDSGNTEHARASYARYLALGGNEKRARERSGASSGE